MATATLTTTTRTRKKTKKQPRAEDSLATLKPLYPPAARAFLRREVGLTQSLIDAAFLILNAHPPNSSPDPYAVLRRKWDLLRITLETTMYSSITGENHPDALPANLRSNLTISPSELVQTLHTRSIHLHSPKYTPDTPSSPQFLPLQILMALVFASLKLDCPELGKNMVEQWLNHRADAPSGPSAPLYDGSSPPAPDPTEDMYERLIEAYCLQILPRLGEWDYAMEFLKYEPELAREKKKHIYTSLKTLHTQAMNPPSITPMRSSSTNGNASGMRAVSPASSISSASTHTAVPATPRPRNQRSGASLSTASISSSASEVTITPDAIPRVAALNGNGTSHLTSNQSQSQSRKDLSRSPHRRGLDVRDGDSRDRDSNSTGGSSHTGFPRPPLAPPLADLTTTSNGVPVSGARPTLFETLRFYTENLGLRRALSSRVAVPLVLVLLSVILPVVAYVVRLRGWMRRGGATARTGKRIGGAASLGRASQAGLARWLFNAVKDTVIMAGKGLV